MMNSHELLNGICVKVNGQKEIFLGWCLYFSTNLELELLLEDDDEDDDEDDEEELK